MVELLDMDIEFWSLIRVKGQFIAFSIIKGEFYHILFFFGPDWV